jgi:hypothetical protein
VEALAKSVSVEWQGQKPEQCAGEQRSRLYYHKAVNIIIHRVDFFVTRQKEGVWGRGRQVYLRLAVMELNREARMELLAGESS